MERLPTASQTGEVRTSGGSGAFHNLDRDHGDTEGRERGQGGKKKRTILLSRFELPCEVALNQLPWQLVLNTLVSGCYEKWIYVEKQGD